jgi:response regulator RpfG family c-di-GMP phosphodiesterase
MDNKYVILCVDDERSILHTMERLLNMTGYKTLTAASGEEGLKIMEKEYIDLVISDQRMPGMTGSEFLKIVKQKYPNTIRIMLSGHSDFENLVNAVNEGEIYRFISKPWDNEELKEILRVTLNRNRVITVVENVIKNVCEMVKIAEHVVVETSDDQRCINLNVCNTGNIFSNEIIFKFIQLLFDTLKIDNAESFKKSSGVISKKEGVIFITFDIGHGLLLKIETPSMENIAKA